MRLFIDDLTSSDLSYTSMNGTQICFFYEEYNASDGTNNANDPITSNGVSVRPPLVEIYFSKYKSNASNATNTYYKMVGGVSRPVQVFLVYHTLTVLYSQVGVKIFSLWL